MHDWQICDTQEKMRKTLFPIETGHISPCRTIEKVDYQGLETDAASLWSDVHVLNAKRKAWRRWFGVSYRLLNDRFTIKFTKKEMDFESLVGYIGGYVGLFAGFAVAEIPGMLSNGIVSIKRFYGILAHGDGRKF